ncbi:hypothetical protein AAFC00_004980 [Neodothiora populina]|uniref:Alpha/beta hydrolase fold-3 domain-containing protein n=1 Tax=Neodothiora populina TaxID=2781224 RepID=A0ABR3P460_9PEZI
MSTTEQSIGEEQPQQQFGWFTYAKYKAAALAMRTTINVVSGPPNPHPDATIQVPTRSEGRTMSVNVYYPPELTQASPEARGEAAEEKTEQAAKTKYPILINYHGSGFTLPRHGEDDDFCRLMSSRTQHIVLDCPYRLAPEHPFPAGVHDVEDLIQWVLSPSCSTSYPTFDTSKLSISGFSAGGNYALVASSCDAIPSIPRDTFRATLVFYPCTEMSMPGSEKKKGFDESMDPAISPGMSDFLYDMYMPPDTDRKDPRLSPMYVDDMSGYPGTVLVITAAGDSLGPEGERFADRLIVAGGEASERKVVVKRMEKCNHAFDKAPKPGSVEEKARDEAYQLCIDTLLALDRQ